MRRTAVRSNGFTLIEMTVILAVLAILAAAITPMVLQRLVDAKTDVTRQEAKLLHEAMLGRAGEPGSFGFFGDMGRWPVAFEELLRPAPATPLFTTATFRNVGMGWKGPYINTGASGDLWWISVTPIDGSFYMAGANGLVLRYDPASALYGLFGSFYIGIRFAPAQLAAVLKL